MRILWLSVLILLPVSFATATEDPIVEGQVCVTCTKPNPLDVENLKIDPKEVAKAVNQCEKKSAFVDPAKKSAFFEIDPKNPTFENRTAEYALNRGKLAAACLYGVGDGVVSNLGDLVMLVPELIQAGWDSGKWVKKKIGSMDLSLPKKNLFTWENIKEAGQATKEAYRTSVESAKNVITKASDFVKSSYEQGGAGGALSAVAIEAWETSPHRVVKKVAEDIVTEVDAFANKEWKTYKCLSRAAQEEFVCKLFGYVLVDVITGKVLYGNLAKAPKLYEGLKHLTSQLMSRAKLSKDVVKSFERTPVTEKLENAKWQIDGKLSEKGQDVEVAVIDGKAYARGIDPETSDLTYYLIKNDAKNVVEKVAQTEQRASQILVGEQNPNSRFAFSSGEYAQSDADFVSRISKEVGIKIDGDDTLKIGAAFNRAPEYGNQYGDLMKSVDDLKAATNSKPKASLEAARSAHLAKESQDIASETSQLMARLGENEQVNLPYLRRAIEKSVSAEKIDDLKVIKSALHEMNKSFQKKGNLKDAMDDWSQTLKTKNPKLTEDELKSVQQCFINGAVK